MANRDVGQYWIRQWLFVWRHQAITWTSVDFSIMRFSGILIHVRRILQPVPKLLFCKITLKIIISNYCQISEGPRSWTNLSSKAGGFQQPASSQFWENATIFSHCPEKFTTKVNTELETAGFVATGFFKIPWHFPDSIHISLTKRNNKSVNDLF